MSGTANSGTNRSSKRSFRHSTLAAIVGTAAIASVGFAAPAMAGSTLCDSKALCLYDNSNFNSMIGEFTTSFGVKNISGANDNKLSSWENKRSTNAAWYDDPNGGGTCNTMSAGRENASLGFFSNDGASSYKTNGGC